jgi:hypothetical protein
VRDIDIAQIGLRFHSAFRILNRSVVKQNHVWPTPRNRRGSTFPSDQPSLAGFGSAGHFACHAEARSVKAGLVV